MEGNEVIAFFATTTKAGTLKEEYQNSRWLSPYYNPQNEMLPFHKTKCSETQNEMSSL
jgi:hypothetical protein